MQQPGWPKPSRMLGTLLYVIGLSVVFGLLTTIATDGQARSVSYTEFKQLVRAGKVAAVTITPASALHHLHRRIGRHRKGAWRVGGRRPRGT